MTRVGTFSVTNATRGTPSVFQGSVSNVHLEAWDLSVHRRIPGQGCIIVSSATINVSF